MTNVTHQPLPSVAMRWHDAVEATRAEKPGKLDFLRKEPTVSQGEVKTARNLFGAYFGERIGVLGKELGIPDEKRAQLYEGARAALNEIMDNTFSKEGADASKMKKSDFKEMVKTANMLAQQKLMELNDSFGSRQTSPQIVPFKTSDGQVKITVLKPAPPIENLVLRGGGAKGIGNSAALVELEKAGMLAGLKTVVGTSAGALTAVGLACGMSATQFSAFAAKTDIGGLKDSPGTFKTTYPMIETGTRVGYTAGNALKTLDEVSNGQVKGRLDGKWDSVVDAHTRGAITDGEFGRLKELKKDPDFNADRTGKMVTFGDLRTMSKVFPDFKELTLTGMNRTDSKLAYFDADKTPDMPIAVAGRISMSIPFYFASVDYDAGEGRKTWVDGGVGSNMPSGAIMDAHHTAMDDAKSDLDKAVKANDPAGIESASKKLEAATKRFNDASARTLLMTFDEGGKAYEKMSAPPLKPQTELGLGSKALGSLAGDQNWGLNQLKDAKNIHDAGPNVIVVHHGSIGTLDLDASADRVAEANLESQMRALEQIALRQNQASHDVFNSADTLVASLSAGEMKQIVDAGPPDLQAITAQARSPLEAQQLYGAALEVYEKVAALMRDAA